MCFLLFFSFLYVSAFLLSFQPSFQLSLYLVSKELVLIPVSIYHQILILTVNFPVL